MLPPLATVLLLNAAGPGPGGSGAAAADAATGVPAPFAVRCWYTTTGCGEGGGPSSGAAPTEERGTPRPLVSRQARLTLRVRLGGICRADNNFSPVVPHAARSGRGTTARIRVR